MKRPTERKIDYVSALDRGMASLRMAARLTDGWNGTMPRDEARALLNELARLKKVADEQAP